MELLSVHSTRRKVAGTWMGKRTERRVFMHHDGVEYVYAGSLAGNNGDYWKMIPLRVFMDSVDGVHEVISKEDMANFARYFDLQYERLYGHEDNFDMERLVSFGDAMIDNYSPLVSAFREYREDYLSSDREVAAFVMAMQVYLY